MIRAFGKWRSVGDKVGWLGGLGRLNAGREVGCFDGGARAVDGRELGGGTTCGGTGRAAACNREC